MTLQKETEKNMLAAIEHLKLDLKKIRTGHANTAMVEDVHVDVYGTNMRLRDLASITTPEARQILITPFDPSTSSTIGKAIEKANLGFNPIVDGNAVRINIPQMDAAVRAEMVKMCHKKREDAKISLRNIRRDANEIAKKQKNNGEFGEDELKKVEKNIQELTDKYSKVADEVAAKKETEVSTI